MNRKTQLLFMSTSTNDIEWRKLQSMTMRWIVLYRVKVMCKWIMSNPIIKNLKLLWLGWASFTRMKETAATIINSYNLFERYAGITA